MFSKKLSLQIILMPIIFIFISFGVMTIYEINDIKKHADEDIERFTQEYIKQNKKIIYNNVQLIKDSIDYRSSQMELALKKSIKFKVDGAIDVANSIYEKNKDKYNDEEIKEILKSFFSSAKFKNKNGYFFVINLNTNKVIVNKIKKLLGKDIINHKDAHGLYVLKTEKELLKTKDGVFLKLHFAKPSYPDREFPKLVYVKKIKQFNWMIGTGAYLDDVKKELQKITLKRFRQFNIDKHLFILELLNIDGGKDFAKVLLDSNKIEMVGKHVSDDYKDISGKEVRKDFLNKLKTDGETYQKYWYKNGESDVQKQKITYFYHQKEWDWIIASGFYFDDLQEEIDLLRDNIEKRTQEYINIALLTALLLSTLVSIIAYFFARRINRIIARYSSDLNNQNLKLHIQSKTFRTIFENSIDGVILIKNGRFFDFNNSALNMFGLKSKDEALSKRPSELSPKVQLDGENTIKKEVFYITKCFKDGFVNLEWLYKKVNNELFEADLTLTKIKIDEEDIIHAVIRDISDKKRLIKEDKAKNKLLLQQSRQAAMGEMIGNIAHQWRQPLNALGLTVQKIKMFYDEGMLTSEKLDKSVEKSKMLINSMSTTIDDFRNFFRTDKVKNIFNLNDAIEQTLALVEASLKYNGITVDVSDTDKEINILGFKNELEQVLLNIINNAKDALMENKIQNSKIEIRTFSSQENVTIEISDNAGGVPKDIIDKIFNPYFTTKEQGQGTGIGLYMSKTIIETNMNGKLSVSNSENGAKFIITIEAE